MNIHISVCVFICVIYNVRCLQNVPFLVSVLCVPRLATDDTENRRPARQCVITALSLSRIHRALSASTQHALFLCLQKQGYRACKQESGWVCLEQCVPEANKCARARVCD